MTPAHARDPGAPWYAHTNKLLLGAGALATAGLAVFALWDRIVPPDVADVASIALVEVSRRATLNQFAVDSAGPEITLGPADDAAGPGTDPGTDGAAPALGVVAAVTPNPVIPDSFDPGLVVPDPGAVLVDPEPDPGTPTPSPTPSGAPSPTPTPTPTSTTTGSPTPSPTPTPDPTVTPTPTPTPTQSGTGNGFVHPLRLLVPSDDVVRQVLADPVLDEWDLEPKVVFITTTEPVDPEEPDGEVLEPEEVAERLAEALDSVEVVDDGATREPVGWVVSVGVTAQGLAGVPLLLTWSLDGVEVPQSWAAQNVAYRLTATTPDDAGSVEVWVPDLEGDSPYNANVVLTYERDGLVAARRTIAIPSS